MEELKEKILPTCKNSELAETLPSTRLREETAAPLLRSRETWINEMRMKPAALIL